MSGGVRNLRAMFENKDQSTSPPENRGRSPGAVSTGAGSDRTSPRPLSKIRTSFVMVEKSGQIGLQLGGQAKRESSGEPSLAKRRESFRTDEQDEAGVVAQRKESIAQEFRARKNSIAVEEIVPETAVETPSVEPDKQLGGSSKRGAPKPSNGNGDLKKTEASTSSTAKPGVTRGTNGNSKPATHAKDVPKPTTLKTITKPAAISTSAKTSVPSKASPRKARETLPKTPTTPSYSRDASSKAAATKKTVATANESSKPASQSSATARAPRTRIQASPPQTGFVKPKPRSPTRPVKLPASLTAHTASSGSKLSTPPPASARQSSSRASGTFPGTSQSRSPSRASSRPSLGPPPSKLKKQPSRTSLPAPGAAAPDSFLARMMRPTTSSAAKTADKPDAPLAKVTQTVKKPVAKVSSAPKARAAPTAATASTAPKVTRTAAVAKPAQKENKHINVPVKTEPLKPVTKEAPKQALKEVAKPAAVMPAAVVEPAAPVVPEEPVAPIAAETAAVETAPLPQPEVFNTPEFAQPEPELEVKREAPEAETEADAAAAPEEHVTGGVPQPELAPAEEEEALEEVPGEELPVDEEELEPEPEMEEAELEAEEPELETEKDFHAEHPEPAETSSPAQAKDEADEVEESPAIAEESEESAAVPETALIEPIVSKEAAHVESEASTAEEAIHDENEAVPKPVAEETKAEEPEVKAPPAPAPPSLEKYPEPVSEPELSKPTVPIKEDPEDVKAREEIARLNAQVLGAPGAHHANDDEVD